MISSGSLYDRPARFYQFYRIHCLSAPFIHSCVNNPCLSDCSFACNSCTSTAAQQYERSERGKNSEKWLKSTPQRQHHGLSAFQTSVPGDKTVKTLSFGKIGCVLLLDCPGSTHRAESALLGSSHAVSKTGMRRFAQLPPWNLQAPPLPDLKKHSEDEKTCKNRTSDPKMT